MKLLTAQFEFAGNTHVMFDGDEIVVLIGKDRFVVDNKPRPYGGRPHKPCVSHCTRVIEYAERKAVKK